MEAAGINICQETPWGEELDDKELHGAVWWQVRSGAEMVRFFLYISAGVNTTLTNIYKCGIMMVLNGLVFSPDPLYCFSSARVPDIHICLFLANCAFFYTDESSGVG